MIAEWYRSPDWDVDAREDFERRLRRARGYSRPQYLRIKGLALEESGEIEGARQLWLRVLDSTEEFAELHQAGALEHLADSYAIADPSLAKHYYRRLLTEHPSLNGTTATQHIKLAELLLDEESSVAVNEAAELLTRWHEVELPFPSAHFRAQLAAIRVAEARKDQAGAREAARQALELSEMGPVFARHPDVGLVDADARTLERLRALAT